MTRRELTEMALALSYEQLQAVAESVKCPVHRLHADVIVDDYGFTLRNVCCDKLKPFVQAALLEYKLVVQRKFVSDTFDQLNRNLSR